MESTPQPPSKSASRLVHVCVSLAILGWLMHQVDFRELAAGLRRANWELLLLGGFVFWLSIGLRAWRWQLLVNKDVYTSSLADALVVTFIGNALNVLLPASMGDVAKSYYGYRRIGRKEVMLSSSLVDKCIGMLAGFVAGFPLAAWMELWQYFWIGLFFSLGLTVLLFTPRLLPWGLLTWLAARVGKRIDPSQLLDAATLHPRLLLVSFVLSVTAWAMSYVQFYLAFLAFGATIGIGHVFALTPVIMLTKLLPLTLDGLGPQEAFSMYLFRTVAGVSESSTLLATLATRALSSWLPAIVGALFILTMRHAPIPQPATQADSLS